jgi:predicted phosphohydrolase
MKLFAISDPHLSFGTPGKSMDRFGEEWVRHPAKIKANWEALVGPDDVVAVTGDISWAKKFEAALEDLRWLGTLPGRKVILRGNHDVWWPSPSLLERELPPGMHFIQNNHAVIGPFVFFGSRLWDTQEYSVFDLIEWDPKKGPIPGIKSGMDLQEQERIYDRELVRLKLSLDSIPRDAPGIRIGLGHYPPLDHLLHPSRAHALYAQAGAKHVIFGHLHSVKRELRESAFGTLDGVTYHLASCDFLDYRPKFICEVL